MKVRTKYQDVLMNTKYIDKCISSHKYIHLQIVCSALTLNLNDLNNFNVNIILFK